MTDFMIRFLISNVFIAAVTAVLALVRGLFSRVLSARMRYLLWFVLLGLLAVPFLPFRLVGLPQLLSGLRGPDASLFPAAASDAEASAALPAAANWTDDFVLSVSGRTSSFTGFLLSGIWLAGILLMLLLSVRSALRLRAVRKSALPLQNQNIRRLYRHCRNELGIRADIPVYSTAFLKSPVIAGLFRPCISLPLHLISDYEESGMRYILLHELQHYRHGDALAGSLMNLAAILYWFNPAVWYALKEMRADREIACDASVLQLLEQDAYEDYGRTLINFAEKLSLSSFPFAAGLGGNGAQLKRRIRSIASYQKPTVLQTLRSTAAFLFAAVLLFGSAPFLSVCADDGNRYRAEASRETFSRAHRITYTDLSAYFGPYEGSFVLYDSKNDSWKIHDMEHASLRVSPNSTYKLYDALFGLEEGVITPENSAVAWSGESYPFDAWNADQTLQSAMSASVNWYFQTIDERLGAASVSRYVREIGYGNEAVHGDFPAYWMESSLKISPIEQVELLIKLQQNRFGFSEKNIDAVKDAIRLSDSDAGTLYGKTGTGRVNGKDINGWFIGFVESGGRTYFFAANIGTGNDDDRSGADKSSADGSRAAEITLSILSDMKIW